MGDAEPVAQRSYAVGLGGAVGAQAMIDRGDLETAGDCLVGKQQQGQAVGSARNSETDWGVRLDQRPKCSGETLRLVG